jgi:hypothetical protein
MQHDPIEFGIRGLADSAAADRVQRLASQLRLHARTAPGNHGADVVDEAFATFPASTSRVTRIDAPRESTATNSLTPRASSASTSAWEPVKREIVADLTAQLDLLDSQRDRLARLLHSINQRPLEN